MKKIIILFVLLINNLLLFTKIPLIPDDYIIFEQANSGYDLYIKKIPWIESILLTESQKDPNLKKTNYGLRTPKFHPCNGNEKRILNDKILHTKYDAFFLLDSTLEPHYKLDEVFHFFLPEKVLFGYKWTRQGELTIKPGIKINLRLFKKKYADYSSEFLDQYITLTLQYQESNFRPDLIDNFKELSNITGGKTIIKKKDDNLDELFEKFILDNIPECDNADVVFIIDTTISMKEEMPYFQKKYPIIKNKLLEEVDDLRLALIFYRDYGEMFLTKVYDLTDDLNYIDNMIDKIYIEGGDDIPEGLHEAIAELENIDFKSPNRIAYLIGDAPAHPSPRGNVTKEDSIRILKESDVTLNSICLPFK